jgi:hypothetical protein
MKFKPATSAVFFGTFARGLGPIESPSISSAQEAKTMPALHMPASLGMGAAVLPRAAEFNNFLCITSFPRTAQPNKTEGVLLASLLKDKSSTKPKKNRPTNGIQNNRGKKAPAAARTAERAPVAATAG